MMLTNISQRCSLHLGLDKTSSDVVGASATSSEDIRGNRRQIRAYLRHALDLFSRFVDSSVPSPELELDRRVWRQLEIQ